MAIKFTPPAKSKVDLVINLLTMSHTTVNGVAEELKPFPGKLHFLASRLEQTAGVIAEAIAILEGKYTIGGPKTADDTNA